MYYTRSELLDLGFSAVGENNKISKFTKFYSITGSILGSNNRIDDFCLLKGKIELGDYIHIAGFCLFSGVGGVIKVGNYSGFSSHCSIWTATEDFVSPTLTSPSLNKEYSKCINGNVIFSESVKVGSSCIFLPNIEIGFAVSIAANTLVNNSVRDGAIIGPRERLFKVYGFRDMGKIKTMKSEFEKK